ncbi:MAG: HEAT repeat domain-containing protein [Sandaracinaceae bacterium]|nr:HEAT repeat domain-containing protein [Sandaracinaceae bacterium]
MSDPRAHLRALFEADRALRHAERTLLLSAPPEALADIFAAAADRALKDGDAERQELELVRLADLCAQIEGPVAVETLLRILDHADPAVRAEAGEALLDVAYERFKEVANAIERALDERRDGVAMEELPYMLSEIHDPDPLPLMVRFLVHPRAEVVASAIEAIVERADPAAVPKLRKLLDDPREVTVPELDDEKVTIGDLAVDALSFFAEVFEDEEEEPAKPAAKPSDSRPKGGPRGPAPDRGGRRR